MAVRDALKIAAPAAAAACLALGPLRSLTDASVCSAAAAAQQSYQYYPFVGGPDPSLSQVLYAGPGAPLALGAPVQVAAEVEATLAACAAP